MQQVRHANRGRLLLRTPDQVPLWDQSLHNLSCFRTFEFRTSLGNSLLLLKAQFWIFAEIRDISNDIIFFVNHLFCYYMFKPLLL